MNALTLPRKAASLEYYLLRLPATVLEKQVVTRFLQDDSALRLGFERAIGSLDEKAGRLFDDEKLEKRGHALRRRSEILATAAELEEKAAQRKAQAEADLREEKQRVAAEKKKADQARRDKLQKAAETEQAEKKRVAAEAAAREVAEKKRIEAEARRKVEAATKQADKIEASIDAKEKALTAAPKAQLSNAAQEKAAADAQREQAEKLERLAQAEKDKRQAEREAAARS